MLYKDSILKITEIVGINILSYRRYLEKESGETFIPPDKEEFQDEYLNNSLFRRVVNNTVKQISKEIGD